MPRSHTIAVKRIYEAADAGDGARFLVDRLWPRGVSKDKAALTAWLKPLSPSDAMREEFHHATANSDAAWSAFRKEYFAALEDGGDEVADALVELEAAMKAGTGTLIIAAQDESRNTEGAPRG